ncbi:hexokinase-domain-containing protein [Pilobolus umbonatus]|nr:hexokinase-domain-containing protein [Pilobolus umbonatus]
MATIVADNIKEDAINELGVQFYLSTEQLKTMSAQIVRDLSNGLKSNDPKSAIPMLPSWISQHPTGHEKGECLALDLSGSNVRVYLINFSGFGHMHIRQLKYSVKEETKTGSINGLIDFMAECLDSFLTFVSKSHSKQPIPLGLCLSFPLRQTALNNAAVMRWTKDFDIQGADNKNIVDLLQTAISKRRLPVTVKAALNGASSCLLAHCYRTLDTLLAVVVSSGTNAAYWEKFSQIEKFPLSDTDDEMIINTEWGRFGDNKFDTIPHTFYDVRVNRQSINPGVHVFEKMISGLYLGEIVRLIVVDFMDKRLLFDGQYSTEWNKPHNFDSSYMSAMELDDSAELDDVQHILEKIMNIPSTTLVDRKMAKRICQLVGTRAARLTAAGISAIITKTRSMEHGLSISVEGTVYEHYANFPDKVVSALHEIYGSDAEKINIGITRDCNGVGAGLAAIIAADSPNLRKKSTS